tara:strand:+ start:304 stop:1806 length:1503 start_codon:yes stop_codon:yes gene_type:complete
MDEERRIELLKFYMDEGYDLEGAKQMTDSAMEGEKLATGGRVGMQTGGLSEYEQALADLKTAQGELPQDSISVTQKSPGIEALLEVYGPNLANLLKTPVSAGGQEGLYGSFLPEIAGQDPAQTQAYQMALKQAYGAPGGVAQYQQYLNNAANATGGLSSAATAGQNAGLQGIANAQGLANLGTGAAISGQGAGSQALTNAQAQANLMSGAAAAGQGAGDANFAAAQGYTGPQGYQEFMSPYQQEVIDSTMAEYQQELAQQQAQLGLSAGNAFGGSRFGVAQGELGAQGAQGMASQLAQLRQAGFQQANQLAGNAYQQQMGLGQAAQQQAQQNQALYGQAMQGQQGMAQGLQNQASQNLGLYGQGMQQQLAGSQAANQQAAQNVGLMGQSAQAQSGLAQLQPQLAMQNIGFLDQLGKQQQLQAQAKMDAEKQGNKMLAYEPYDRYGFFGGQLTGIMGGYPGGTSYSSQMQQTPNAFQQLLGGVGTVAGIGMGLQNTGMFGS